MPDSCVLCEAGFIGHDSISCPQCPVLVFMPGNGNANMSLKDWSLSINCTFSMKTFNFAQVESCRSSLLQIFF